MHRTVADKEHAIKMLPTGKLKALRYEQDKRREMSGKRVIHLHASYSDNSFPDAREIREWVEDFQLERSQIPTKLLYPYRAGKTRRVCIFSKRLGCVWLEVVPSEFMGLE